MAQTDAYLIRCPSCGTKNRIPANRAGQTAKCGKCKSAVPTNSLLAAAPVMVADRDFEDKVLKSPLPVLLDCWAPWCGPCQTTAPIMTELAKEWKGRARVGKLNIDQNPLTAARFQVMSVPTFLIFDQGRLRETIPGAVNKGYLVNKMRPYLYTA
jgi:thioredoxin 2